MFIFLSVVFVVSVLLIGSHHLKQEKKRRKRLKALGIIHSFHEEETKTKTYTNDICQSEILTGIASGSFSEPSFSDGLSHLDSGLIHPYHHTTTHTKNSSHGNNSQNCSSSSEGRDNSSGYSSYSGSSSEDSGW